MSRQVCFPKVSGAGQVSGRSGLGRRCSVALATGSGIGSSITLRAGGGKGLGGGERERGRAGRGGAWECRDFLGLRTRSPGEGRRDAPSLFCAPSPRSFPHPLPSNLLPWRIGVFSIPLVPSHLSHSPFTPWSPLPFSVQRRCSLTAPMMIMIPRPICAHGCT